MSRNLVEQIRQLSTRKGREKFGRFAIEGTRLVERALRANADVHTLLIGTSSQTNERIATLADQATACNIPITLTSDAEMQSLTNGRRLGDIFAIVQQPPAPNLAALAAPDTAPRFLALVDIIEPGNVGAMIRTAHGLGATAVIAVGQSDPYAPKAVRTAMGSLFRLPLVSFATATEFLQAMDALDLETIATVATGGVPIPDAVFAHRGSVLVMGNEFYGLSAEISNACTQRVTIPMADSIDSFSVSAAAAIAFYKMTNG